jgi:predicted phage-related endonuclease
MSEQSDVPPPVELSPDDELLLERLEQAKADRQALDETIEKLKAELRGVLAQAQEGRLRGKVVVRDRPIASVRVDASALRKRYPEVYDQVSKPVVTWTMNTYRRDR